MDTNREFNEQLDRAVWISDDPIKVQDALDNGFDPNCCDRHGAVTLHRVAKNGCSKALAVLLKHDITCLELKDHLNRTPLHYTIECDDFDKARSICDQLLEAGFDIDAKSQDIRYPTPLFLCVKYKNIQLAAHLLERGANIHILNLAIYKYSILECLLSDSAEYYDEEIAEMFNLFLHYNVNTYLERKCHPIIQAICEEMPVLVEAMSKKLSELGEINLTNYEEISRWNRNYHAPPEPFMVQLVSMVDLNPSTIIKICDNSNASLFMMLTALPYAIRHRDLQVFNYLYSRLVGKVDNERAQPINLFVHPYIQLSKDDFMLAIEKLFAPDFGHIWTSQSICESLAHLFDFTDFTFIYHARKYSLDDVEIILCHMLQFVDYFSFRHLSRVFLTAGENFHLIMKFDPKVLINISNFPQKCRRLRKKELLRVCYPSVKEFNMYKNGEVPHLWELARDVIRQNISIETPEMSNLRQPRSLFSYYNNVQNMNILKVLKDIILLKQ